MNRRWVVNASPLIALAKIDMLWLLEKLCIDIAIPTGVIDEINEGPVDDPARRWIISEGTRFKVRVRNVPRMITAWDLGKGESQVLSWAAVMGYSSVFVVFKEQRRPQTDLRRRQ